MTTSGEIGFSLTAQQIVEQATLVNGYRDPDEALEAAAAETCRLHLNLMLKSWQADGCNLWREQEDTVTFGAGVARVDLDPRVIDVMEARISLAPTNERAMNRWEWGDYSQLPNKAAAGDPTIYCLRRQRDVAELIVWPVPTISRDILYTAARVIEDVSELTQTLDVPQEWLECVIYGLAARLCEPLGVTTANPNIVARIQQRADALYERMRDMDRPSSVTMQWVR